MAELMEAVAGLLREAADTCVLPVFGREEMSAEKKAPGEWVTLADTATESFLTPRLAALVDESVVVGEEAASADPRVFGHLRSQGYVWLLDPLDGTANFVAGMGPFAVMAALLRRGETVASWMLDPLSGQLACAQRGAGAWLDGRKVTTGKARSSAASLKGAVLREFLPRAVAAHVVDAAPRFAGLSTGTGCAGADYPAIVTGIHDFILYWRTLPWYHAPGVLFIREAGGAAMRLDGSPYQPADHARPGLFIARNTSIWEEAAAMLMPDCHPATARPTSPPA